MFEQIRSISRNAFSESLRQPLFVVLLVTVILLLTLNLAISAYAFNDEDKLLTDMSMSTLLIAGVFLAAFSAAGVFGREITDGTILTVISKPVTRPVFVIGKFLGVLGSVGMAYWIWAIVFLLTARHKVMVDASMQIDTPVLVFGALAIVASLFVSAWTNFFYRWNFASTLAWALFIAIPIAYGLVLVFNREWKVQDIRTDIDLQLLTALLLIFEALAIMCAIAIAAATRLGQLMTLAVCLAFFFLGLSSDYLFGQSATDSRVAAFLYGITPNMQILWLTDALTQKHAIGLAYFSSASLYSALVVAGVMFLAVSLFQTREAA